MKKQVFDELLASVEEGARVLSGQQPPARTHDYRPPDVRAVRQQHGLSQSHFAALMGISIGTLRNWEQGRRRPEGSARVLLEVVAKHPEAVFDSVRHPAPVRRRA
jgi:putative transcriptional regulator